VYSLDRGLPDLERIQSGKAFSGQGAKDWGGRWNSRGVAVVYTATHLSLSMYEVLVDVKGGAGAGRGAISAPFYMFGISLFDTALLEELPISGIPAGWNSESSTSPSQSLGDVADFIFCDST
jgi:RES domain